MIDEQDEAYFDTSSYEAGETEEQERRREWLDDLAEDARHVNGGGL